MLFCQVAMGFTRASKCNQYSLPLIRIATMFLLTVDSHHSGTGGTKSGTHTSPPVPPRANPKLVPQ